MTNAPTTTWDDAKEAALRRYFETVATSLLVRIVANPSTSLPWRHDKSKSVLYVRARDLPGLNLKPGEEPDEDTPEAHLILTLHTVERIATAELDTRIPPWRR